MTKSLADFNTMPQMTAVFAGWTNPITIKKVVQTVDADGFVINTETSFKRNGILQPLSPEALQTKPDGQRSWKWYQLHLQTKLFDFENNDIININDIDYKVMQVSDYTLNNYVEYHIIRDYE